MNIEPKSHSYYKATVDSGNNFAGFVKMEFNLKPDKEVEKELDSRIRKLKYHPYGEMIKVIFREEEKWQNRSQ